MDDYRYSRLFHALELIYAELTKDDDPELRMTLKETIEKEEELAAIFHRGFR